MPNLYHTPLTRPAVHGSSSSRPSFLTAVLRPGVPVLDRRRFLSVSSGLAAALTLPKHLLSRTAKASCALPDPGLYGTDPDTYWAELRKKFLIPRDEVYLNNGTVGSSPEPVLRAVFDGYNTLEQLNDADPEDYPIWGYASWNQFRDPLAQFVGST